MRICRFIVFCAFILSVIGCILFGLFNFIQQGLSKTDFITILIVSVIIISCLYSITVSYIDTKKAGFYVERIYEELNAVAGDSYNAVKRNIFENLINATLSSPKISNALKEYRNSLVEFNSKNAHGFVTEYRASDFFNSTTICSHILERRPYIPQAATALGIFGTFIGLLFGLGQLEPIISSLSSNNNFQLNVHSIDIKTILAPFTTAFLTSIAGIFYSIMTTWLYSLSAIILRKNISELTTLLDHMFEPGMSLDQIRNSEDSDNSLTAIVREIRLMRTEVVGAVVSSSDEIGRAITKHMQDINKNTAEIINQCIENLNEKMTKQISGLTEQMAAASKKFSTEIVNSSGQIKDVFTQTASNIQKSFDTTTENINAVFTEMNQSLIRSRESLDISVSNLEAWQQASKEIVAEGIKLQEMITNLDAKLKQTSDTVVNIEKLKPFVDESLANNIEMFAKQLREQQNNFAKDWSQIIERSINSLIEAINALERVSK
jgi:predicted glycoside hydrolase/deacetylase ChbG (UPF0249 family)